MGAANPTYDFACFLEVMFTHQPQATYFAATKEELIAGDEHLASSVKLADGGYIAALGVYHEIHCLVS